MVAASSGAVDVVAGCLIPVGIGTDEGVQVGKCGGGRGLDPSQARVLGVARQQCGFEFPEHLFEAFCDGSGVRNDVAFEFSGFRAPCKANS